MDLETNSICIGDRVSFNLFEKSLSYGVVINTFNSTFFPHPLLRNMCLVEFDHPFAGGHDGGDMSNIKCKSGHGFYVHLLRLTKISSSIIGSRPKRQFNISNDDILNLKITLNTINSVDDLLLQI